MHNYKRIGEFRFWVQKVLPLVYDDSLSYYELVSKICAKLNEVIDSQNELLDNFGNDLRETVENILNEWKDDGTFGDMLKNFMPLITPEMFGAVGDGVTDDTSAIQRCIDENPNRTIYFNKTYLISDKITLYGRWGAQCIYLGGSHIIVDNSLSNNIDAVFYYLDDSSNGLKYGRPELHDGYIECNDKANIGIECHSINNLISGVTVQDPASVGIQTDNLESSGYSSGNIQITNCNITNRVHGAEYDKTGIRLLSLDNIITGCTTVRFRKGISLNGIPQSISNCHLTGEYLIDYAEGAYPFTYGIYVEYFTDLFISSCDINNCYIDNVKYMIGGDPTSPNLLFSVINVNGGKFLHSRTFWDYVWCVHPDYTGIVNISDMQMKGNTRPYIMPPTIKTDIGTSSTVYQDSKFEPNFSFTRNYEDRPIYTAEHYAIDTFRTCLSINQAIDIANRYKLVGAILQPKQRYFQSVVDYTISHGIFRRYEGTIQPSITKPNKLVISNKEISVIPSTPPSRTGAITFVVPIEFEEITIDGIEYYYIPIYAGAATPGEVGNAGQYNLKLSPTFKYVNCFIAEPNVNKYVTITSFENYLELLTFAD